MSLYFDYAANTPCDKRVIQTMCDVLESSQGNPSSMTHLFGLKARGIVEEGRAHIAHLIGSESREVIFTSGATESNNLAIKGAMRFLARAHHGPRRVITLASEHSCVLGSVRALEEEGYETVFLPVQGDGRVDLEMFKEALKIPTCLVSVSLVNNETGVIQDIATLARLARRAGALFHCDGAQGVGKIPVDVRELDVDLLSISGHKIYGPQGVGALYVRRRPRVRLQPLFSGGGQERGIRPGTLAPSLAAGLGYACYLCTCQMDRDERHITYIRDLFMKTLRAREPDIGINGCPQACWPGIVNIHLPRAIAGADIIASAKALAFSLGSACQSSQWHMSHVLRAMGLDKQRAQSSIRLSFGRPTTADDARKGANMLANAIQTIRDV